jgi:hypothetical protein
MFPRNSASLVRSSSGFSPQALMISLSWSILLACVLGLMAKEKYSFLRTKSIYYRCMEIAQKKYGWKKKAF